MSKLDVSKYHIRTFGCQMNEHDSERIAGLFEDVGMQATQTLEDSDVILLNTCCIRENADNKFYGYLGQLKEYKTQNPNLQIAVAGCLAQKDREVIRQRANHVDVVFGTHNIHRAVELLTHAKEHGPIVEILEEAVQDDLEAFPSALPASRSDDYRAWVTIQIGCDNSCAFCIVPSVRGPEISRPMLDILDEVETLASSGVTEVTLLGQNVNSYGRDISLRERQVLKESREAKKVSLRPKFAELLRAVAEVDGISRVRYISPHPKDLLPETISAMAETTEICEHLHLPLQSGSDKILAAMHRGYTAERFLNRLSEARSQITDLAVSTDIIVGFPTETEADFEDTLEVAAKAQFDAAYAFIFSPRPGTEAAQMAEDFVDPELIKHRFERLQMVLKRSALLKHEARVGRVEEVLVEGPSAKDPTKTTGRTRQNKLVHWDTKETQDTDLPPGSVGMVEIVDAAPYFLRGELKEVISRPENHKPENRPKNIAEPTGSPNPKAVPVLLKSRSE